MSAILETVSSIKRILNINVPKETIDEKVKIRLQETLPKIRLPGFRPGKAPIAVVRQQFGASIRSEVISQLIEQSYTEAITSHQLNPAGMPKITVEEDSFKRKDLQYKVELEVFPEFKVTGLSDLELVKFNATIKESDLVKMFENLQKQHVKWEHSTTVVQNGDRVTLDYEGFKNEEPFPGGKAENFKLIIGSKTMIPGFEDSLIGKSIGEEFDVNLSFPEDYHVENLKGQPVLFKIKIKELESPVLPSLNDEFAKLFEVETLDELRKEVTMNMERELEFALKSRLKDQVVEGLLKHNDIEVPEVLIQEEAGRLAKGAKERMKSWGQKNIPDMATSLFLAEAKKRVALGLIMNQIIQEHAIKPDPEKVKLMVEKMASIYDNPAEVIEFFRNNKVRMAEIEQIILEEQVVEHVASLAKVREEEKDFDEIMSNNPTAISNMLPQG